MSKVCQVTGKRPQSGNNVSHANNRTRRRFLPNLQNKRFWLETEKRYIRLRVSQKGLRLIENTELKRCSQICGPMAAVFRRTGGDRNA